MYVLSPNAMTVILIEHRHLSGRFIAVLLTVMSAINCDPYANTKGGSVIKKEFTWGITDFDTKKALENPAYSPGLRQSKYHTIHPFQVPKLKQNHGGHKVKLLARWPWIRYDS